MNVIKPVEITAEMLDTGKNGIPIFICSETPRIKRKLEEAGYVECSVNLELSKALLNYSPKERFRHIEEELKKLLGNNNPRYVSDFEMLFDPRYEFDAVRFFCDRSRYMNLAVKWPGKYCEGHLYYAEPENPDYRNFDIQTYNILVIN